MYKLTGIVMVCCALWGFLYSKVQAITSEYNNLKEMIKALTYLKQELKFSSGELGRVCKEISGRTQLQVSEIFENIADTLKENVCDFYQAWYETIRDKKTFSKETENALEDFAQNLGKKSLDIELENIEKTIEILSQIEEYEGEKTLKNKKLIYTLGASVGAALIILVI